MIAIRALTRRQVAERCMCALPIAVFVLVAVAHGWTSDGGFAYFRVVDQLLAGNGPVLNAGERVESVVSPAWLLVLTASDLLSPLRLEYTAAIVTVVSGAAALTLGTVSAARLAGLDGSHALRIPLGLGCIVALWPFWVWTTSGTEISLAVLWLGASFWVMTRWAVSRSTPIGWPGLVLLGLGWVVRPELAIASALFITLTVLGSVADRRARWRLIGTALAVPIAYQLFRMGYYAMVWPSSIVARGNGTLRPGPGWDYLADAVGPYLLFVPLFALLLGVGGPFVRDLWEVGARRATGVISVMVASGLLTAAMVISTGGDTIHARLLVPSIFALLLPFLVVGARWRYVEAFVLCGGWIVLASTTLRPTEDRVDRFVAYVADGVTADDRSAPRRGADQPWLHGPGVYVADEFGLTAVATSIEQPADLTIVAMRSIGPMAYSLGPDVMVLDLRGGGDTIVSHQQLADPSAAMGERRTASGSWVIASTAVDPVAQRPDVVLASTALDPSESPLEALMLAAWAEDATGCDVLAQLIHDVTGDLTPGSFLSNIAHAAANTRLVVESDPRVDFTTRCLTGLPSTVTRLSDQTNDGPELPDSSAAGELFVIGACGVIFIADPGSPMPWWPVDGSRWRAEIAFSFEVHDPAAVPIFRLGPYDGLDALVTVETDGVGRYRVRQSYDFFPEASQEWTPIPDDRAIDVVLAPDPETAMWVLRVDGEQIAERAMMSADTTPVRPAAAAGEPAGGIVVEHPAPTAPRACVDLADPLAALR